MGKQLVIVGADFSAVAIGTAKVLVSISATISGTQYTNSAPTGITVTATWDDQSTSTVSGWTTSPTVWGSTVGQQTMTISYTRGGVTKTTTVTADVQEGTGPTPPVGSYTVSANITDGTAASVSVASGGTATLTVVPNSGHTNPTSVTVSSGTCGTPTISGATITVPNVTSNVTIAATCPAGSSYLVHDDFTSYSVNDKLDGKVIPGSSSTYQSYSSTTKINSNHNAIGTATYCTNIATMSGVNYSEVGGTFKATSNSGFCYVLGKVDTQSQNYIALIMRGSNEATGSQLVQKISGSNTILANISTSYSIGTHNYRLVFESGNVVKAYEDSTLLATASYTATANTLAGFMVTSTGSGECVEWYVK